MEIVERCIGLNGINFVRLRRWEAWVSRKLKNSTTLCFPNKCGVRSIIQTPSAIGCSKIDFFLKSSIHEARDSICDSYAWKSILSARDVIRNGKVWCISNGYLVGIKQDKWLPNQSSITPISALPDLPRMLSLMLSSILKVGNGRRSLFSQAYYHMKLQLFWASLSAVEPPPPLTVSFGHSLHQICSPQAVLTKCLLRVCPMTLQVAQTWAQPRSFGEVFGSYVCQRKFSTSSGELLAHSQVQEIVEI